MSVNTRDLRNRLIAGLVIQPAELIAAMDEVDSLRARLSECEQEGEAARMALEARTEDFDALKNAHDALMVRFTRLQTEDADIRTRLAQIQNLTRR